MIHSMRGRSAAPAQTAAPWIVFLAGLAAVAGGLTPFLSSSLRLVALVVALAILVPLWGVNGVAAALSGSYALSLATLLILAMARGEMPYGTILAVGPRAAWNRLRMLSESRSSS